MLHTHVSSSEGMLTFPARMTRVGGGSLSSMLSGTSAKSFQFIQLCWPRAGIPVRTEHSGWSPAHYHNALPANFLTLSRHERSDSNRGEEIWSFPYWPLYDAHVILGKSMRIELISTAVTPVARPSSCNLLFIFPPEVSSNHILEDCVLHDMVGRLPPAEAFNAALFPCCGSEMLSMLDGFGAAAWSRTT